MFLIYVLTFSWNLALIVTVLKHIDSNPECHKLVNAEAYYLQ